MKHPSSKHIRLDALTALFTFIPHGVIVFMLSPLYAVLYSNTLVPDIVLTLINGLISVLDFAIASAGFTLITAAFFMNIRKKWMTVLIYLLASLFRRIASIGMTLLIYRVVSLEDVFINLTILTMDTAMLLVALAVIGAFSKYHIQKSALKQKASLLFNNDKASKNTEALYPFKKLFEKTNPLQVCLLCVGAVISFAKLLSRSADLFDTILVGTGTMSAGLIAITVLGYVADVLLVVLSYALSCFILSWLYGLNERRLTTSKLYGENASDIK